LDAAKLIATTYLKNQMENGSWYQFTDYETNVPLAKNILIPTSVINYFDRLSRDYKVPGLEAAANKALAYTMAHPVKTFDWQGQFEDVFARPPYKNLSREQACELAMYLLNNAKNNPANVKLAEELIRFSEDQFVIWEQPRSMTKTKGPGWQPQNWITPSVQEQYVFWNPVGRAAGIMMDTYWHAFKVTNNSLYKAKAESLANAFTLVQKEHDGDYPTFFTRYKMPLWLNSVVYPAKMMMQLDNDLKTAQN
jgi:maltose/maltodextrin transport system substrate-binding protein